MTKEIAKLRQELARSKDAQRVSRACIPPTLLLDYTTVNGLCGLLSHQVRHNNNYTY